MTLVHFAIHRFTTDVEELDERALARLVDGDDDLAAMLSETEGLEGALVIGDASIADDLGSAIQRLCFEAVEQLVAPGTTYEYAYFTSATHAAIASSADGATISLSGDDIPSCAYPRESLLPALYACGQRYLAFLHDLGRRGRTGSTTELAHLQPFADRAQAALAASGLTST